MFQVRNPLGESRYSSGSEGSVRSKWSRRRGFSVQLGLLKSISTSDWMGLMKAGKHPSIDAIRIELGNTGSKATIYRHLKEIEADEGGVSSPQASVSEELQAFVANLAGRLEYEAKERLDTLQSGHAAQLKRISEALDRCQADARIARIWWPPVWNALSKRLNSVLRSPVSRSN